MFVMKVTCGIFREFLHLCWKLIIPALLKFLHVCIVLFGEG